MLLGVEKKQDCPWARAEYWSVFGLETGWTHNKQRIRISKDWRGLTGTLS